MRKYKNIEVTNVYKFKYIGLLSPSVETIIAESGPQYFMVYLAIMRKVYY
jgi:hypothetical protein